MNDNLRWKLVLGCALIAALEIPQGLTLVLQDLGGPYTQSVDAAPRSAAQIPRATTSVAPNSRATTSVAPNSRATTSVAPNSRATTSVALGERRPTLVTLIHPWLAVPTVWSDLRGNSFDLERSTTALALGR